MIVPTSDETDPGEDGAFMATAQTDNQMYDMGYQGSLSCLVKVHAAPDLRVQYRIRAWTREEGVLPVVRAICIGLFKNK